MCLPLSLLLLLPVPGLLLAGAVAGLSAHGPAGVAGSGLLLWAVWRVCLRSARALRSWWARAGGPPGRP